MVKIKEPETLEEAYLFARGLVNFLVSFFLAKQDFKDEDTQKEKTLKMRINKQIMKLILFQSDHKEIKAMFSILIDEKGIPLSEVASVKKIFEGVEVLADYIYHLDLGDYFDGELMTMSFKSLADAMKKIQEKDKKEGKLVEQLVKMGMGLE